VTFHNITDPYNMEPTPEPENQTMSNPIVVPRLEERPAENFFHIPYDDAPGLEALSAAATSNFEYIRPLSATVQSPGETNVSQHSSNNLNFILNPQESSIVSTCRASSVSSGLADSETTL
jgi:hypothetical protein